MKLKLLFFLFFATISFGQVAQLSDDSKVSIFTCGRGAELYSTFGHSGIRIKDKINNLDIVFNYGAFDFRTENFYFKFIKGDLNYFITANNYVDFVYEYQYENREVIEQTLDLSLQKKQQLFDKLYASMYSDEKNYQYKFIDKNCTTMVADKVNESVGSNLIFKIDDKSISYRQTLYPFFEDYFYYKLGIMIIFGKRVDEKATQLFLPVELMHSLDKAKIDGKPLVTKTEVVVKSNLEKNNFSFFDSIYFISLLLLILLITRNIKVFKTYLFLTGILGLFLCLVGFYSFHKEVSWNYNALLFNPLLLIFPFVKNSKWIKNLSLSIFVMLIIYFTLLLNKPNLLLMIPFVLTSFLMTLSIYIKNKSLSTIKY